MVETWLGIYEHGTNHVDDYGEGARTRRPGRRRRTVERLRFVACCQPASQLSTTTLLYWISTCAQRYLLQFVENAISIAESYAVPLRNSFINCGKFIH